MAEYFDLINSSGKPLNKKKLRKHVHRDGNWHRAIDIWILNSKGELLIQKRAEEKESYPGLWEISCSGHITAGDKPLPSAVRECKEELGIEIKESDLKYLFEVKEEHITNNSTFINREIKDVFLLEKDLDPNSLTLQKDEVSAVRFIPHKKLEMEIAAHPEKFVPHKQSYTKFFEYLKKNGL